MFDNIIDTLNDGVPKAQEEYIGEDGLLHCAVCNCKTETIITHPFTGETRKVRCKCSCKSEQDLFEEQMKVEELERKRRICFAETNMSNWTFENDDRKNGKISDAMKNYSDKFHEFKSEGKGVLLYGSVGTGKTYLAACVANSLIDKGYRVHMTNFSRLINKLHGMFDGKQEYIDSLNRYDLLIIDDLGIEGKTEYRQEIVFNVIDSRYRSGLPFIVTTNLTAEDIKKPQDVGYARIYDRILEKCFPVEMSGVSRRRESLKQSFPEVKAKLGL